MSCKYCQLDRPNSPRLCDEETTQRVEYMCLEAKDNCTKVVQENHESKIHSNREQQNIPTQFGNFLPSYVPAHIVSKAILNIIKPFETVLSAEKNYQLLWPHVKIFSTTLTPRKKYDVCGTTSYPSKRKKSQGAWDSQQRSKCKKKVEKCPNCRKCSECDSVKE